MEMSDGRRAESVQVRAVRRITRPTALARHMAEAAHDLRAGVAEAIDSPDPVPALGALFDACRDELQSDLTAAQFADVVAQTAAYALFVARWRHTGSRPFARTDLARLDAPHLWLGKLLHALAGDELAASNLLAPLDALANLLAVSDLRALFPAHESDGPDPVITFYESFLRVYDPALRARRGVYITPAPLVGYIARSVDALLADESGVRGGLAGDSPVAVLDPACGTGAFLAGILGRISAGGCRQTGPEHAPADGRVRLVGCELLPVPYLIAHLALGARLASGRVELVLGDALADARLTSDAWPGCGQATGPGGCDRGENGQPVVSHRDSALVIVGNPPYAGHSANDGDAIGALLRGIDPRDGSATASYFALDAMPLAERNLKWLGDDYVKFIRAAQWQIERFGHGIVAFVTSSAYLESPTFRAMRRSLMRSFDAIYLLDLGGNGLRRERRPSERDAARDENIFGIRQGVAIGLFVRRAGTAGATRDAAVHHVELRGERARKLSWLARHDPRDTPWSHLAPSAPLYSFAPRDARLAAEYQCGWPLTSILPEHSLGLLTKRDALVVGFTPAETLHQVAAFADPDRDDEEVARTFRLALRDKDGWDLAAARAALAGNVRAERVRPLLYRPFDTRFVYYDPALVARPNARVLRHLADRDGRNVALVVGRQGAVTGSAIWDVVFATAQLTDQNLFRRGGASTFPLYLHGSLSEGVTYWRPNLDPAFVAQLCAGLGMRWRGDDEADREGHMGVNRESAVGPRDVLAYLYAVLWAPSFRARYSDFLKDDFPRIPLIANAELFRELCALGQRLLALHLGHAAPTPRANQPLVPPDTRIERIRYAPPDERGGTGRVWLNASQCVEGVSPAVWAFTVGGYRVAEKWLKDRAGRTLTADELRRYQTLLAVVDETLAMMAALDVVISRRGGWPLALAPE